MNDSTVKGKLNEVAGKAKQAFGNATGDQSTANSGAAQEVKGHGEQAWGSVKDAAHDATASHESGAASDSQNLRTAATSEAAKAKQGIDNAVDKFKK